MKRITQKDRVLKHLQIFGSINLEESIRLFGIFNLSRIICELKNQGLNFNEEWLKGKNRFGEKIKFKNYILKEN